MVFAAVLYLPFVVRFSLYERKTNHRYTAKYQSDHRRQSSAGRGDRVSCVKKEIALQNMRDT
jgi:hypothetical protein